MKERIVSACLAMVVGMGAPRVTLAHSQALPLTRCRADAIVAGTVCLDRFGMVRPKVAHDFE